MLAMTREAADAVERIVTAPEVSETAVLRIVAGEGKSNGSGPLHEVSVEVVSAPLTHDLVVPDMRLAVEPTSLPFLDDKLLDAELSDGAVEFLLYDQPR